MNKPSTYLVLASLFFSFSVSSQSYIQQTTPRSAAAKLFFFDRSSNGNADRNWKIATLPASTTSTGDKIMIELFGGSHGSSSTFQQIIHMGNRSSFYGKLRATYGEKYESVRIRAFEQTSGEVDVYLSILSNGWKGASVKVYEGSAIIGVPPTIYENPTNVGASPNGTLVFDSFTEIPGMVIRNNGNVGIGTTSPGSRLNVGSKTSNSASSIAQFGKSVADGEARVLSLVNSGGGSNQSTSIDFHNKNSWSSTGKIQLQQRGTNTQSLMHFYTYNSGLKNRMTLDYNGNLGIGTTTPDEKLTVKGKIHSEEVRVDLSVPGPDYVFESDYNLRTLAETEEYIKENKHLPEIPSAKQMEANGVELGEMNMLLLKKIEELTLHVIALKKEIEELKEK